MGYTFALSAGQWVYLENLGEQTQVTRSSHSPGQQQQSSSSVRTGLWTAAPEAFRAEIGVIVKLYTAQGERFLHVQGSHFSLLPEVPSLAGADPVQVQSVAQMPIASMPSMPSIPLMQPMQPLSPMPSMTMPSMTMGDRQQEQGGMSMQMGSMHMSMSPLVQSQQDKHPDISPSPTASALKASTDAVESVSEQRNFCSQCGVAVKPSDRFCASCGQPLG